MKIFDPTQTRRPARTRLRHWQGVVCPQLLLFAILVVGCESRLDKVPVVSAVEVRSGLDSRFVTKGMISLEENDNVITVIPRVNVTPSGNILVADESESQIRLYRPDGRLLRFFGRKGAGPGEFKQLNSAVQLRDGRVIAIGTDGTGAVFDSIGRLTQSFRTPISPVYISKLLNDSTLIITGKLAGRIDSPMVHLWSVGREAIITSFFVPPITNRNAVAASVAGWVNVAVRADTVAALFALSDTVYLFTSAGMPIRKIPIPFDGFRLIQQSRPSRMAKREVSDWMETFSLASDLFWTQSGDMFVQYKNRQKEESIPSLLAMDPAGRKMFEASATPLLLMTEPASHLFYFVQPGSLTRNKWMVAQWAD